jgi:hypothetical protein
MNKDEHLIKKLGIKNNILVLTIKENDILNYYDLLMMLRKNKTFEAFKRYDYCLIFQTFLCVGYVIFDSNKFIIEQNFRYIWEERHQQLPKLTY